MAGVNSYRWYDSPEDLESAARAALNESAGHTLSAAEWRQTRADLLALVSLLRSWHQDANVNDDGESKVIAMSTGAEKCQRVAVDDASE